QPGAHGVDLVGVAPVGDDAGGRGVAVGDLGEADLGDRGDLVGGAPGAADDEQHGRTEVGGHAGVEGELGGPGDVGVVGADDDDGVAAVVGDAVAVDDRGEGGVGVGVDVLVGDADGPLVGGGHALAADEQVDDVVVVGGGRPGDGPEDPRALDTPGEQVDETEGDERLAGEGLQRRDVDAAGHG